MTAPDEKAPRAGTSGAGERQAGHLRINFTLEQGELFDEF